MDKIKELSQSFLDGQLSTGEYHVQLAWIFGAGKLTEEELGWLAAKLLSD